MSSGILKHTHFEELCALAAIGEISPSEHRELSEHLHDCASCRDFSVDLLDLTHRQLPLAAAEKLPAPPPVGFLEQVLGTDYKARFAARARERGIEISADHGPRWRFSTAWRALSPPKLSLHYASLVVILALLVSIGVLSRRWKNVDTRSGTLSGEVLQLSEQNAALQKRVETLSEEKRMIETELLQTRSDTSGMATRMRELEEHIKSKSLALEDSKERLDAADAHRVQTEQELRQAQQTLLALKQEIMKLQASRAEGDATFAAQQVQIAELSRRARGQEEVIQKQQKLLGVDQDVRNLMAARSLHITDVFDVDGKGKKRSAFGRVFYTEGRSLIFYAFDLEAPRAVSGKDSFQAWGQLADSSTSAVNLGVFYVDDAAQKRWMLRFDNPEVLKQINAVFVTAEAHGGAERPTGQKLMYAYLGHEPNHP